MAKIPGEGQCRLAEAAANVEESLRTTEAQLIPLPISQPARLPARSGVHRGESTETFGSRIPS
jgi:hypothetical protein